MKKHYTIQDLEHELESFITNAMFAVADGDITEQEVYEMMQKFGNEFSVWYQNKLNGKE
jgi:transcription-repair coupling factor (superfamily II helicase)